MFFGAGKHYLCTLTSQKRRFNAKFGDIRLAPQDTMWLTVLIELAHQKRPSFQSGRTQERQVAQLPPGHKDKLPQPVVDAAMLGHIHRHLFLGVRAWKHVIAVRVLQKLLSWGVPDELGDLHRHQRLLQLLVVLHWVNDASGHWNQPLRTGWDQKGEDTHLSHWCRRCAPFPLGSTAGILPQEAPNENQPSIIQPKTHLQKNHTHGSSWAAVANHTQSPSVASRRIARL